MRDNPFVGVVTTLRPDGSPHSTVVWVDVDDDGVSFNTARGRVKPNNIESDPRIALTVVNPENTYQWVSITGTASLTDEGADGQIDRLAKKYLGQDSYPWRQESEQRVSVRIAVGRVSAVGFDA
ncbi:MAG: TIGR03618 family F420-dependent PPOX class oxidoreductase [Thermoleophilia bacterium]|nr:TIGR03618 family F420-dependent PPOX class oxidoreductase [Thermoleophilia bacterium]